MPFFYEAITKNGFKRTPYPAIIQEPNYFDVLKNLNRGDYGVFFIYNLLTIPYMTSGLLKGFRVDKLDLSNSYMQMRGYQRFILA
jgi:hypothetical protein